MKGIGNFVSIRHVRQLRSMSSCLLTRPSTRTTIHLYFSPRVSHSDSSPPSPSSSMFSVYKFFFSLKCVLILWEIFFFVFFFLSIFAAFDILLCRRFELRWCHSRSTLVSDFHRLNNKYSSGRCAISVDTRKRERASRKKTYKLSNKKINKLDLNRVW